jgi:hypothetical protein
MTYLSQIVYAVVCMCDNPFWTIGIFSKEIWVRISIDIVKTVEHMVGL